MGKVKDFIIKVITDLKVNRNSIDYGMETITNTTSEMSQKMFESYLKNVSFLENNSTFFIINTI